jgi:putative transposase
MSEKSKYNPNIHHRRSIRLKGYDYSQAGLYFITICCQDRIHRFGHVANGEMKLNEFGTIAFNEWEKLPERFTNFELDVFQIMPNHMHGIIVLNDIDKWAGASPAQNNMENQNDLDKGSGASPAQNNTENQNDLDKGSGASPAQNNMENQNDLDKGSGASPAPTIFDIVGAYKSLVVNVCIDICNLENKRLGKLWQRNYYEHIIRDERSYQNISNYIINNPAKWEEDKFFTK